MRINTPFFQDITLFFLGHKYRGACRSLCIGIIWVGLFSGCQPAKVHHGHVVKPSMLKNIGVGKSTKEAVKEALGSPTCIFPYDPNTFYYLSHIVSIKPLMRTQPASVLCYALTFSDAGILLRVVSSRCPYPLKICPDEIPLPSRYQEGFFQQMIRSLKKSAPVPTISPF